MVASTLVVDLRRATIGGVRVVAGSSRGRTLVAPEGQLTRPTSDRVREATFNALVSLDAVDGADVLDLFAGSGALGIEALSRGAASCTFVEHDRRALAAIRANLDATGLGDRATVVGGDALRFLDHGTSPATLVLADPPYAFDDWDRVLASVDRGLLVIESDREIELPPTWEAARRKWYGGTLVLIARRPPDQASQATSPTSRPNPSE
jgi:16S rRNA (guanine966-N2)-methyltransferase